MRFKRLSALILAAGAGLATSITLLVTRRPVDAVLTVAMVAALVGLYRLRRYARAALLYNRRPTPGTAADVPLASTTPYRRRRLGRRPATRFATGGWGPAMISQSSTLTPARSTTASAFRRTP